ncbi:52 kDa repressor of the inhibitor of the protein kinase-like [Saccostrea cucullata]|uniref:52 kDa repressor of the inhibitor of the protein kinase-like n=1 Tax=Saccostrea cuccullata TaxID=36930 RepID=UPI002ED5CB90
MRHYLQTYKNSSCRIDNILDTKLQIQVAKNRKILTSILKCVEFCGRQGIPLRSHRDDDTCDDNTNLGNLKELLKLCCHLGEDELKDHLQSCAKNAKYSSKTTQNELLDSVKIYLQREIVNRVKHQKYNDFFGIQADEVSDVSNKEQLGLVIRYLEDDVPVERFVEYVVCESVTGEALSEQIIKTISSLGLDMNKCRSQSYDGAGNMAGANKGCASRIKRLFPRAEYYYCMNHDLNLAVAKSCRIPEIQIMLDTCKQIGLFFKFSPKRQHAFQASVDNVNATSKEDGEKIKSKSIKTLCETRWIERHTTVQNIAHAYEALTDCLTNIVYGKNGWDVKSITESNGLLSSLCSSKWIVAIHVYLKFSGYLKSLSGLLQGPTQDIISAFQKVNIVIQELEQIRRDSDHSFNEVWDESEIMAKKVSTTLAVPRMCNRQTSRNNVSADTPEQYFCRSVFIPYLDHLLSELKSRFSTANAITSKALSLIPSNLHLLDDQQVRSIVDHFENDLPCKEQFFSEIQLWKREWSNPELSMSLPDNLRSTIQQTNSKFYPNISTILRLLLLMPVSAASVERSHSHLKDVKTKKRCVMSEDRLNSLMLLYIHRDLQLDYDKIIDIFASKHPRRLQLAYPLS